MEQQLLLSVSYMSSAAAVQYGNHNYYIAIGQLYVKCFCHKKIIRNFKLLTIIY